MNKPIFNAVGVVAAALCSALMFVGCYIGHREAISGDAQHTPSVSTFTDDRDGRNYKKVKIGEQTWMAENLNHNIEGSKCYGDNPDFCARYGRLYNWDIATKACPTGWHLPSDAEWTTLTGYVGSSVAKKIKSRSGWNERSGNGTDDFGFSALPGGIGAADNSGDFIGNGYGSGWWTATESNASDAWTRSIIESVDRENDTKTALLSVRCVQDGSNVVSTAETSPKTVAPSEYATLEALRKLVGIWKGSYVAGQGETGLTLTVYEEEGKYKATFDFHNLPGKNNSANGKYYMDVSYNISNGRYSLNGSEWIVRPSNYGFANLDGILTEDVFSGSLSGSNYNFSVARVNQTEQKQSTANASSISTFTDSRDGKTYKQVKIGNQTWMAENLNYAAEGSKCYENKAGNCEKYGRLYNWSTAKGACPAGWHLPSDAEWTTLEDAVWGSDIAGKKLKAAAGWNEDGNGTNDYAFSALPGGYGNSDGSFGNAGYSGFWCSATENDAGNAWSRYMYYNYERVGRNDLGKSRLFSVRCVQN